MFGTAALAFQYSQITAIWKLPYDSISSSWLERAEFVTPIQCWIQQSNLQHDAAISSIDGNDRFENETSIFLGRILLSTGGFEWIQQKGGIFF